MNKNVAGILSAAAVLTMLAGCTAYDRTKDQFTQPVVKDVKKGMTRSQVPARPIFWVNVMVRQRPTLSPWMIRVT